MKMRGILMAGAAAAALMAAAGCAKQMSTPANEEEKRYFDAWMHVHHPELTATGNWIYIEEETAGKGKPADSAFVFVTYTAMDLSGNVSATSDSTMAKRLNTWQPQNYYGPVVWNRESQQAGVYYSMLGMNVGGTRRTIIPGWLMTYSRYTTEEEYLANVTGGTNSIYEIKITGQTGDISKWQVDSMYRFVGKDPLDLFGKIEAADSAEYGFYYEGIINAEGVIGYDTEKRDTDTASTLFPTDTTVYINYTGRLLNGQVFDTTVERTAKDNNIYSSSRTYEPVSISWGENYGSITMGSSSSSVISGFAKTLWRMSCVEGVKSATGMFWSNFGYGYSGSGSTIPAYAPLIFEIEFTEEPED